MLASLLQNNFDTIFFLKLALKMPLPLRNDKCIFFLQMQKLAGRHIFGRWIRVIWTYLSLEDMSICWSYFTSSFIGIMLAFNQWYRRWFTFNKLSFIIMTSQKNPIVKLRLLPYTPHQKQLPLVNKLLSVLIGAWISVC